MNPNGLIRTPHIVLALAVTMLGSPGVMAQPAGCGPYPGCLYTPPASYRSIG